jgi:CheY-like chemotaxis protein
LNINELARVLLVDGDLASRLTLKTLLQAGGYRVDGAASAAEAIDRLDLDQYQLVLCDLRTESQDASSRVVHYARHKEYRPAAALITSFMNMDRPAHKRDMDPQVVVNTQDVSNFLDRVAELIGLRAFRRSNRILRQAS